MAENIGIRLEARAAGVPLWKVARALGVSEPTLYRWLRAPLSGEERARILGIIEKLKDGGE